MEKVNYIKSGITLFFAALSSLLGVLAIPIFLLAVCNVSDYLTGVFAAPSRGDKINSYKGIRGIVKKVSMYVLVIVAAGLDMLIVHAGGIIGMNLPFKYCIACIVTMWLVLNEMISILENISDLGVAMPPFLMPFLKHVKSQVEDKNELIKDMKDMKARDNNGC